MARKMTLESAIKQVKEAENNLAATKKKTGGLLGEGR